MNINEKVRQERTGWRDEDLSRRHRKWGFNCPSVDLDFLMIEYNHGLPVAMVEYKHFHARTPNFNHPTYRAISDLADNYKAEGLPFVVAFYYPDNWSFKVFPVNSVAKKYYKNGTELSERRFVESLYYLRGLTADEAILKILNTLTVADSTKG